MKSKTLEWTARSIALLFVLAACTGASGQTQNMIFNGYIDAYTPQTTFGPYEVHGPWTVTGQADPAKADFSAEVNMEFSDGWVLTKNNSNFDPTLRSAHTHHITLVNATVAQIPNGFRLSGTANFDYNGAPAPTISPSPVQIDITGGSVVQFSNITLTFQAPGSTHFGPAPLPGVVQTVTKVVVPPAK